MPRLRPWRLPRLAPARPYSARRTSASFTATLALVAVLAIDHTAATVHAAQPLGSLGLNNGVPLTIAHRGDPAAAPENTLPAFEAAVLSGAEVLELDLRVSADGHAVVIHDKSVDRTTDGTGLVSDLTLAELQALDAGSWYGSAWEGTSIPTFDEFLPLVQNSRVRLVIELKDVWSVDALRPVVSAIYRAGVQDRVVLASFESTTVLRAARVAPSLQRAVITRQLPDDPVGFAAEHGASTVITSLRSFQLDPGAAERLRLAGLTVIVYTLNRADLWQQAVDLGVDGVVTDAPRRLAQQHASAHD